VRVEIFCIDARCQEDGNGVFLEFYRCVGTLISVTDHSTAESGWEEDTVIQFTYCFTKVAIPLMLL